MVSVLDLVPVLYSAAVVFEGVRTGRAGAVKFLTIGDASDVVSRADLAVLQDLSAAAAYLLKASELPLSAEIVRGINASMTRSAALVPGALRQAGQGIGVNTRYGRHEPAAMTDDDVEGLVPEMCAQPSAVDAALTAFIRISAAQPFGDGNKRTALMAANHILIHAGTGQLLMVPHRDNDPELAEAFHDALARAYIFGAEAPVRSLLLDKGLITV
nr:Fic family protein [Corynebacterium sp. c6VSa_13]